MGDDFTISLISDSENEDGIPSVEVTPGSPERSLNLRITNSTNAGKLCLIYFQASGNLGTYSVPPSFSAYTCYNKLMNEIGEESGLYLQIENEDSEIKISAETGSQRENAIRRSIESNQHLDVEVIFRRVNINDFEAKRFYIGLVAEAGI